MRGKAIREKNRKWKARQSRSRNALGTTERVQLTVYRSAKHIYAQLVDSESGKTVGSVSSRSKGVVEGSATGNIEAAKKVGTRVAELAKEKNIDKVVFNRNGFLYHGRIKALADAAREAGLQF